MFTQLFFFSSRNFFLVHAIIFFSSHNYFFSSHKFFSSRNYYFFSSRNFFFSSRNFSLFMKLVVECLSPEFTSLVCQLIPISFDFGAISNRQDGASSVHSLHRPKRFFWLRCSYKKLLLSGYDKLGWLDVGGAGWLN